MNTNIDLEFRPRTYFRPERLERYLLSKTKNAVMREKLKALFEAGQHDEIRNLVGDEVCSEADRKRLESIHPMFMGGNYLPDNEDGEIEIARIRIQSTTFDVTSVYARNVDGVIHYRVVDEYGGDTLQGPSKATTTAPMSLGELADFFLSAWPLIAVLEMNFEDDLDRALGFFSADSDFYPHLDRLCRLRVCEHFSEPQAGDDCPFCHHFNSPKTHDFCKHAVAWVWDGQVEPLPVGQEFLSAFQDLAKLVESTDEGSPIGAMLTVQADRNTLRQNLIEAAALPLHEAFETLTSFEAGTGWSTKDPIGGFGHTICVREPADLVHMNSECRAILDACTLKIQVTTTVGSSLESRRPAAATQWKFVASGFWSEDIYHSGYIEYFIANLKPGCWLMETRKRNAILDGVTEEDVKKGRLNDDQIQAMWGITLEEAQKSEYREIVAYAEGAEPDCTAKEMAAVLYRAVCEGGGEEISFPDDYGGLLDV